jgi:hypothetical protein
MRLIQQSEQRVIRRAAAADLRQIPPRIVAKARPRRRSAVVIRDARQQVPRVVRTGRSLV